MEREEFKLPSLEEIAKKLQVPIDKAKTLRTVFNFNPRQFGEILQHYDKLSNRSLSDSQVAKETNQPENRVVLYRSILNEYKLMQHRKKRHGQHIKKLCTGHGGERYINISPDELQKAGLDPKEDYYIFLEPQYQGDNLKRITIVLGSKEDLHTYKKKKLQL